MLRIASGLIVCALLAGFALAAAESDPRPTMDRILTALVYLLPLSLDEETFADPAHRSATLLQMDAMVKSADALRAHGASRDPAFRFLARSLEADVRHIRRRYKEGRYEEARFYVENLTETCVACHARLPDPEDAPIGRALIQSVPTGDLTPAQRARLQMATRQFDAALATLEAQFRDPAQLPAHSDMAGFFIDYLTLCIRVKRDYERPDAPFAALLARSDTSWYLRRNLEVWLESLAVLQKERERTGDLAYARDLVERGHDLNHYASGQEGLVYHLKASAVLHGLLSAGRASAGEQAEAYYLLGVADVAARRSYWVSQAEFFLETAIRIDPGSPFAERSFELLEEYTILGYSGSSGVHIPPDVELDLAVLRALIEAARQP